MSKTNPKSTKFKRKNKLKELKANEAFKPIAKGIEIKRLEKEVADNPEVMVKRTELENTIRMYMAEWCADYPALTPENYLKDIKGLDDEKRRDVFVLIPNWIWIEKQSQFADEVVKRLTVRGVERVAQEYNEDMKTAKKAKQKILDMFDKGKIKEKITIKTCKETDEQTETKVEIRLPLEPSDYRSLAGAYETLQKVTDRALGITDNNREAVLENIKTRERQAKESDQGVKKVKELTFEDAKELINMRREQRAKANEQKEQQEEE